MKAITHNNNFVIMIIIIIANLLLLRCAKIHSHHDKTTSHNHEFNIYSFDF